MRRVLLFSVLMIGAFIAGSLSRRVTEEPLASKKHPSPFGIMAVGDPTLVHIRRGTYELLTDWDYEQSDLFCWQLHLPQGKQWELCWAFGEFQRDGVPTTAAGRHTLAPTKPNEHPLLHMWWSQKKDGSGWNAGCGYGDVQTRTYDTWLVPVPDEQGPSISRASNSFVTAAGEEEKTAGWVAQTYTGEKPIVILRLGEANMDGGHRNDPYNGVLMWLEQASNSSNKGKSEVEARRAESAPR